MKSDSSINIELIPEFIASNDECPQDPRLPNYVNISSPKTGDEVGLTTVVRGTVSKKDQSRVWVLLHRKDLKGQWWPQNKPVVDADGTWEMGAYFGQPVDIGFRFEIAVATFGEKANEQIEKYHEYGVRTGQYLPMRFPKTTSNICIVTVKKTSHD